MDFSQMKASFLQEFQRFVTTGDVVNPEVQKNFLDMTVHMSPLWALMGKKAFSPIQTVSLKEGHGATHTVGVYRKLDWTKYIEGPQSGFEGKGQQLTTTSFTINAFPSNYVVELTRMEYERLMTGHTHEAEATRQLPELVSQKTVHDILTAMTSYPYEGGKRLETLCTPFYTDFTNKDRECKPSSNRSVFAGVQNKIDDAGESVVTMCKKVAALGAQPGKGGASLALCDTVKKIANDGGREYRIEHAIPGASVKIGNGVEKPTGVWFCDPAFFASLYADPEFKAEAHSAHAVANQPDNVNRNSYQHITIRGNTFFEIPELAAHRVRDENGEPIAAHNIFLGAGAVVVARLKELRLERKIDTFNSTFAIRGETFGGAGLFHLPSIQPDNSPSYRKRLEVAAIHVFTALPKALPGEGQDE